MKQKLKYLFVSIALVAGFAAPALLGGTAFAITTQDGGGGGGDGDSCAAEPGVEIGTTTKGDCADTAFSFGSCGTKNVSIGCLIASVMKFMSILVGILVVGGITVGGIVYSTGGGNSAKTQKGITIITNSVIGLVLYLLMFAIVNFLIPGGILT